MAGRGIIDPGVWSGTMQQPFRNRGFLATCRVLVAAAAWATVTAVALGQAPQNEVTQGAARAYKRAEARLRQGRPAEAEAVLRDALQRHPRSGVFRSGLMTEPYYPHYLLGLSLLRRDRFDEAAREFLLELDQEQIQHDAVLAEALALQLAKAQQTDNQPPVVGEVSAELVETVFGDDGGEIAHVRFSGSVIDHGGVAALTVDGQAVDLRPEAGGHSFDVVLPVDAARPAVPLTATDVSGNRSDATVPLTLPPLDLGDAARGVHALVVGVDRYPAAATCPERVGACDHIACYPLPDLAFAARDAERFHAFLLSRGVPAENVRLLTSRGDRLDATRQQVLDELQALQSREGDRVLFYFAGHGVNSTQRNNLMLLSDTLGYECAGDDGEPSALERTAIGIDTVTAALARARFAERYVILDACRSPRSARTRGTDAKPAAGFRARGLGVVSDTGRATDFGRPPVVFYATFDESVSVEWHRKQAGYFTWYLLQGLRRDLSLWELKAFVQENVRQRTHTDHGVTQKPHVELPEVLENDYELQQRTFILGRSGTSR